MKNSRFTRSIHCMVMLGLLAPTTLAFGQQAWPKRALASTASAFKSGREATVKRFKREYKLLISASKAALKRMKGKTLSQEEKKDLIGFGARTGALITFLLITAGLIGGGFWLKRRKKPPGPIVISPGPIVIPPGPVVIPERPGPIVIPPGPVVIPPGPVVIPERPGPVVVPEEEARVAAMVAKAEKETREGRIFLRQAEQKIKELEEAKASGAKPQRRLPKHKAVFDPQEKGRRQQQPRGRRALPKTPRGDAGMTFAERQALIAGVVAPPAKQKEAYTGRVKAAGPAPQTPAQPAPVVPEVTVEPGVVPVAPPPPPPPGAKAKPKVDKPKTWELVEVGQAEEAPKKGVTPPEEGPQVIQFDPAAARARLKKTEKK